MPYAIGVELIRRLEDAELEQLAGIVPLVQRVADLEPFIALEANEIAVKNSRDRRCERGFADARLAFDEQRTLQAEREEERGREALVGDVRVLEQTRLQVGYRGRRVDHGIATIAPGRRRRNDLN